MPSKSPACRAVCNDRPGDVMMELIVALRGLRGKGLSEDDAVRAAHDAKWLVRLLPSTSLGEIPGLADSLVDSGCAECAVNWAYGDAKPRGRPGQQEP